MQNRLFQLFATNVGFFKLDIECDKYLKLIEKEKFTLTDKNNPNLSQISIDNKLLENKSFKKLKEEIIKGLEIYAYKYIEYGCELVMCNSWATKTESTKESGLHNHSNSLLSGVVYLQKNTSDIYFENFNKPHFSVPLKNNNIYNSQNYTFKIEPGLMLLFPSNTYHKVLENKFKQTRYSIAFNFLPKGKIGNYDNELIL